MVLLSAALQDKLDSGSLTQEETQKLMSLQASVPVEYLQDWFDRRQKNMKINKELIDETRSGVFDYFALGHDDTSQLSQSALEGRYLSKYSKDIPVEKYGSFPGADQLGLLLMARSRTDESTEKPTFSVIYPLGGGGKTLPGYEDQTIDKTIAQHVEAVGGTMVTQGKPTVLLAVNTPLTTSTGESESFENFPMISNSTNAFVDRIQQAVDSGVNVSVADIAYNNGADNTLVSAMYKRDMLYKIGAYNGWNTASNTVGGELNERLESYLGERIQDFAEKYLKVDPRTVKATFPWGRLFETDITVYDKPVVPLEKELRLKREEEARIKAEAEAKAKAEAAAKAAAEANGQAAPAQPAKAEAPKTTASAAPVVKQPATTSLGPRIVPTPAVVPGQ